MATTDFERAIERSHEALALFSQREDISLGNPFGPYARGRKQVEATLDGAASKYRDGQVTAVDLIATYTSADGGTELVPVAVRVKSLFRREQGEWRLVHRRADPITTPRPAESVIRK
jgi:hypothetical protein